MKRTLSIGLSTQVVFAFIIALLSVQFCHGQKQVRFDYLPGSNDFVFPESSLDSMIKGDGCSAFFYGETHTRWFEPMFKLHYIIYLNKRYDVRDVFMETGYSAAVLFNRFLTTGDTSVIDIKVLYTSPVYMDMWRGLYTYNQTLPEGEKIRVHGVDFESPVSLFRALLLLKEEGEVIPAALEETFRKLNEYAVDTALKYNQAFFQKVKDIKTAFEQQKESIAQLYGTNMRTVHSILWNDIRMDNENRDQKIYGHMQAEIAALNIDKFVGFYGGDHINFNYPESVGSRYKKNVLFKNKVKTIRMFCFDAYDNWSHEVLECIGTYDEGEGHTLKQRYMNGDYRGVLIADPKGSDKILNRSADYYLFAYDRSK